MEVHCTNEEAGGEETGFGKGVCAPFAWEELFLPFQNDREDQKRVILGIFYKSVEN